MDVTEIVPRMEPKTGVLVLECFRKRTKNPGAAATREENNVKNAKWDGNKYATMRISKVQQKAHEKGTYIHGTRV
jgi:hypothetical protein